MTGTVIKSHQIATAHEATPSKPTPGVFYEATTYGFQIPSDATGIVLSGQADGTGDTYVDDEVTIKFTAADGKEASYVHDYSHGNVGRIIPEAPVNLTSKDGFSGMIGETVDITIIFSDKYPNSYGGSNYWINLTN